MSRLAVCVRRLCSRFCFPGDSESTQISLLWSIKCSQKKIVDSKLWKRVSMAMLQLSSKLSCAASLTSAAKALN